MGKRAALAELRKIWENHLVSETTQSVIKRAKAIYEADLKVNLEAKHRDRFIAIEPDSGDSFLADTF